MSPEVVIEQYLDRGDLKSAAATCVRAYGPEVLGFLVHALHDEHYANDAFSQACEELWAQLAHFQRRCSMRTWFYTLARHAASRTWRDPHRNVRRRLGERALEDLVGGVRSETLPYLRTTYKDRFAQIRSALAESDRALLILRVDRRMSWSDVARVLSGPDAGHPELAAASASLRKRFSRLKDEIRALSQQSDAPSRSLDGG